MIVLFLCLIFIVILNKKTHFNYKKISNTYNLININYLSFNNESITKESMIILEEDLEILDLLEKKYIEKRK